MIISEAIKHLQAKKNQDEIEKEMSPDDIAKARRLARECVKNNYKGC